MDAVSVLKNVSGIAQVRFTEKDVVRHRLVQEIVKAYDRAAAQRAAHSRRENSKYNGKV